MWPMASVWGNALLIAAAGAALILAAALGRAIGDSPAGRRLLAWAPLALAFVVVAYVGVALLTPPSRPTVSCIYDSEHPSECREGVASPSRGPSI
jgi:uncharacterized membrane protein YjfL (UPF0719 family)